MAELKFFFHIDHIACGGFSVSNSSAFQDEDAVNMSNNAYTRSGISRVISSDKRSKIYLIIEMETWNSATISSLR